MSKRTPPLVPAAEARDNAPTKKAIDRGYMVQMMTMRQDGKANAPYAHMTRKGLDYCIRHYCGGHVLT